MENISVLSCVSIGNVILKERESNGFPNYVVLGNSVGEMTEFIQPLLQSGHLLSTSIHPYMPNALTPLVVL